MPCHTRRKAICLRWLVCHTPLTPQKKIWYEDNYPQPHQNFNNFLCGTTKKNHKESYMVQKLRYSSTRNFWRDFGSFVLFIVVVVVFRLIANFFLRRVRAYKYSMRHYEYLGQATVVCGWHVCTCIVHKFDPPQQNISTTTNHLLRSPYYTINRTTTNRTPTTPDDRLKDDSRYSIPASAGANVRGAVQFCNWMGIDCFKEDIFCTINFGSCEG